MIGRCAALAVLVALPACRSGPAIGVPDDPVSALDLAEVAVADGRPDEARTILASLDPNAFAGRNRERFVWLEAAALHGTGRSWAAFTRIRDYPETHRFSEFAPVVEDLHFAIGRTLIESDGGFWIFQSDRDDGEVVLQEFVERYPASRRYADALALLGQVAWEDERWSDARRYYQRIVEHDANEWVRLALFRIAMSKFAELVGPEYDAAAMTEARNELLAFLDTGPERPEFRQAATEALAVVEDWLATRSLINARFYRTIDNRPGELHHLRQVIATHPNTPQAEVARERLAELGAGERP